MAEDMTYYIGEQTSDLLLNVEFFSQKERMNFLSEQRGEEVFE